MVSIACLRMRSTEPEMARPYKVPGGKLGIALACITSLVIIGLMVIPGSPANLNFVEWIIVILWFVIGVIFMLIQNKKIKSEQFI
ncbi:hypothetical protein SDC9_143055 [bioreactor metagenome]|uniref:Uncharacterized protein n=1 Tax=bioreactor metagenome TaxID=1076179 RepID=A0A645E2Y8_9ZZZZ